MPDPTRMQDGTETPRVMVSPDSQAGPMLLGQAGRTRPRRRRREGGDVVMREDLELLRHAVQARKAGKLEVGSSPRRASRQAARAGCSASASSWARPSAGRRRAATRGRARVLLGVDQGALRVLRREMADCTARSRRYPGRKGFAMSGTRAPRRRRGRPTRCSRSARRRARRLFMAQTAGPRAPTAARRSRSSSACGGRAGQAGGSARAPPRRPRAADVAARRGDAGATTASRRHFCRRRAGGAASRPPRATHVGAGRAQARLGGGLGGAARRRRRPRCRSSPRAEAAGGALAALGARRSRWACPNAGSTWARRSRWRSTRTSSTRRSATRRRRCSCRRSPSCRCRPRGGRRSGHRDAENERCAWRSSTPSRRSSPAAEGGGGRPREGERRPPTTRCSGASCARPSRARPTRRRRRCSRSSIACAPTWRAARAGGVGRPAARAGRGEQGEGQRRQLARAV